MSEDGNSASDTYIVKLRGLPWSASFKDVEEFLTGCKIKNGAWGCVFNNAKDGRPSGEAYVEFETKEDFEKALLKDKKYIDNRYVEVFEAERNDFSYYKKKYGDEHDNLVRLRGLPYQCTVQEIEEFFTGLAIVPDGITLPKDEEGRCSEAFVQFKDYDSLEKGLKKHKGKMGHRYIEVFMSSLKELEYVLTSARIAPLMSVKNNSLKDKRLPHTAILDSQQKLMRMITTSNLSVPEKKQMLTMLNNMGSNPNFNMPALNMMSPFNNMMNMVNKMGGPIKSYWVRLRGLPFNADEEDIMTFFMPFKPMNVTLDLDKRGKATGEAFAEFPNYLLASQVVAQKNKKNIGHRYIELFLEDPIDGGHDTMPSMVNMMKGGKGPGANSMYGNMGSRGFKSDFNKFKRNRREFDDEDNSFGNKYNDGEGHSKRRMPLMGAQHLPTNPSRFGINNSYKMGGHQPRFFNNGQQQGLNFHPPGGPQFNNMIRGGVEMNSPFNNTNMFEPELMGNSFNHGNNMIPFDPSMGMASHNPSLTNQSTNFNQVPGQEFRTGENNMMQNLGQQGQPFSEMMGFNNSNNINAGFEPMEGTNKYGSNMVKENMGITYYPNVNVSSLSGNLGGYDGNGPSVQRGNGGYTF